MAISDDRLDLDTFPPMDYALPETRRLLDTWKICIAAQAIQLTYLRGEKIFHVSKNLVVSSRATSVGGKVSRWSQSTLLAIVANSVDC